MHTVPFSSLLVITCSCANVEIWHTSFRKQWRSKGLHWRAPPPPIRVHILSFWHTKFSKCNRLRSRRPLLPGWHALMGNPGSVTGKPLLFPLCNSATVLNWYAFLFIWYKLKDLNVHVSCWSNKGWTNHKSN